MAASGDGDDLTAGQTNHSDSGTELICSPRDGHPGNDYVLQVRPGLLLDPVNGIKGFGSLSGLVGEGNFGVSANGGQIGVAGNGNSVGVWGTNPQGGYAVLGEATSNAGVVGRSVSSVGVWGSVNTSFGVLGESTNNAGVVGRSTNSIGVWGTVGTSFGVLGESSSNAGVVGRSTSSVGVWGTSADGGFGVLGEGTNNVGVVGRSANSVGVWGSVNASFGVLGESTSGIGVVGRSDSGTGVFGSVNTDRPGALAGFFVGNVLIEGDLTVTGVKGALVPHSDGSHRLFCAVESPESWFEDFGEAALVNGKAEVRLDPEFAHFVETGGFHIFVTPYGDSNGLYVADRTATGFRVQEQKGGTSNVAFSYRVVAKRKDVTTARMAKIRAPGARPAQPFGALPAGAVPTPAVHAPGHAVAAETTRAPNTPKPK
jgi:hypothetical protein